MIDRESRDPKLEACVLLSEASPIRRTGVVLALIAVALDLGGWWWLYQPSDGFNFGAGFVLLFATALSVAATVVLIRSLGRDRNSEQAAARRRWAAVDAAGRLGALLGVCYLLIWLTLLVLINFPYNPTPLEIAGFYTFVASAALMSASRT